MRQQNPHRLVHGAGEMRDRGVRSDHKIERPRPAPRSRPDLRRGSTHPKRERRPAGPPIVPPPRPSAARSTSHPTRRAAAAAASPIAWNARGRPCSAGCPPTPAPRAIPSLECRAGNRASFSAASFRIRTQIRALPRNCFDGSAKHRGQAQQRAFQIELRQLNAHHRRLRQTGAHHGQRSHQSLGSGLHLQDRHAAARRHQRRVAAELNRVAESLLGVEQHALSMQDLPAPARLLEEARTAMHLAEMPARLVAGPATLPIAQAQLGQRQVVLGARARWIARDRGLVRLERFLHAAQVEQGIAAIRSRRAIAQRLGALEGFDCLCEIALPDAARFRASSRLRRSLDCARAPSATSPTRRQDPAPRSRSWHHATRVSTCDGFSAKALCR